MHLLLLLALLLLAGPAEAVQAKKCPDGQFVVDGPALIESAQAGLRFDAIALEGKKVSIASGCEPRRATLRRNRNGTKLRVRWSACGALRQVRLRAQIDEDCLHLAGTLQAKGLGEKSLAGLFEPKAPPELYGGEAVEVGSGTECDTSLVLDAIEALCALTGASPCVSQTAECSPYRRYLFTGTRLANAPAPTGQWNGRGGSGDPMADAVLCSLRELSPELGGPIASTASVPLGPLGNVSVRQEVGFRSFDRLRERFEGYRRVEVEMPVVGSAQAVAQTFVFDKVGFTGGGLAAGSYPIQHAFALDAQSEDKTRVLTFTPPGFVVATPFGIVTVAPAFTYGARTAVVASPYDGNALRDVPSLFVADWSLRLHDLYGIGPGLESTAAYTGPGNFASQRGGFSSQLGLGTRGTVLGQVPWAPPSSGPILRPDEDLLAPRSTDEAWPSVYAAASAKIDWPTHPSEILPAWVFELPFLDPPIARLRVEPSIEAGVSSQLSVGVEEGADHATTGEFDFESRRLSRMAIRAQAGAFGLFQVKAGVRLSVTADFPFPIGPKTFLDVDETIPIPLYGAPAEGNLDLAAAASTSGATPDFPEGLDFLATFQGLYPDAASAADFVDACYAPVELAEQPVPVPEPVPGDPTPLLENTLWQCNLCIYTAGHPELDLDLIRAQYEAQLPSHPEWPAWPASIPDAWVEVLVPATTPPSWRCNTPGNTGCYDLCTLDPDTHELTVVLEPDDVVPLLPPTSDYDDERALLNGCDFDPPA
jgi:hypothetical protein